MTARDDQSNVHTNREMECIEESSSGADLDWLADALTTRIQRWHYFYAIAT